jgi:hypothetical protein
LEGSAESPAALLKAIEDGKILKDVQEEVDNNAKLIVDASKVVKCLFCETISGPGRDAQLTQTRAKIEILKQELQDFNDPVILLGHVQNLATAAKSSLDVNEPQEKLNEALRALPVKHKKWKDLIQGVAGLLKDTCDMMVDQPEDIAGAVPEDGAAEKKEGVAQAAAEKKDDGAAEKEEVAQAAAAKGRGKGASGGRKPDLGKAKH